MKVISLGAGVQSTTLYLMSCNGELERADIALFADTGWEPRAVYEHLDRLDALGEIPIIRVSNGHIRDDAIGGKRFASMPLYVKDEAGKRGILRRQCTNEYKLKPILRELRRRGSTAKEPAELWLGISLDEIGRMKESRVKYTVHRWPLIEKRMDRNQCRVYLDSIGWHGVPKSACVGCPFRRNDTWRALEADEFEDAAQFEESIQEAMRTKLGRTPYLHDSLMPLREAPIHEEGQIDMFGNECEGLCGL